MVPGFRDPDLEEIRIAEHGVGRRVAAARMSVDARAIDVDPRVLRRKLLHAGHLIGKRVVAHVAVIRLVKLLRPPRCPHAVYFDDDEPELRECLRVAARRRESASSDAAALRSGIDVVDDRILPRRIQSRRFVHQAVQLRQAVARFHGNRRRRLPAGCEQSRDVGFLECQNDGAIHVAQHSHRRHVGLGIGVDEEPSRK